MGIVNIVANICLTMIGYKVVNAFVDFPQKTKGQVLK